MDIKDSVLAGEEGVSCEPASLAAWDPSRLPANEVSGASLSGIAPGKISALMLPRRPRFTPGLSRLGLTLPLRI